MSEKALLLVNFGSPRNPEEVRPFLKALLTDQELLRTPLPPKLHRVIFSYLARMRAKKVAKAYASIGFSPLFFQTEQMALRLEEKEGIKVFTFHRYLEATHETTFRALDEWRGEKVIAFPLFPHFSVTTVGSSRAFLKRFPLRWKGSYGHHPLFVSLWQEMIREFMAQKGLKEEETTLLFSAHSLPCRTIAEGDPYLDEVKESVALIGRAFLKAKKELAFQSRMGIGRWLGPETKGRVKRGLGNVLLIPISFTMDGLETLLELEKLTSEHVFRLPAFGLERRWLERVMQLVLEGD